MTTPSIYKEILLDHFRKPRNKGDLTGFDIIKRGTNPRCGDEIEIGLNFKDDTLATIKFRGRGCSVCLASASMMTEVVQGKNRSDTHKLVNDLRDWINGSGTQPEDALAAFDAVRAHSARKRCVLLAWEALDEAIR